jgi:hypothetical protein
MNYIDPLIENNTLLAFAERYKGIHDVDVEAAEQFGRDLIISWYTAKELVDQDDQARKRFPQLDTALETVLGIEAERRFPDRYAVGGQSREEARREVFEHFWVTSSLELTAGLDDSQLQGLEMELTTMELSSRHLPNN